MADRHDARATCKIPRAIGAAVAVAVFVGTIGFTFYTFSDEAMGIIRDIPPAARTLRERLEAQRTKASETAFEQVQEAATEIDKAAAKASEPAVQTRGVQKVEVVQPSFRISDYVGMGGGILPLGGQFVVILFLVYFMLVTGDLFKRKLVKIAGPTLTKKKITVQILDEINRQIESFIKVQVFTSAVVGVATAFALWWFGVQHFVIWGIFAGVLNSIPYMGPIVVSGGLAVVAFLQFNDVVKMMYVAGTAMVITSLEGFRLDTGADGPGGADEPGRHLHRAAVLELGLGDLGHGTGGTDDDDDQGDLRSRGGPAADRGAAGGMTGSRARATCDVHVPRATCLRATCLRAHVPRAYVLRAC